jgi:rubrerythrin
MRRLDFAIQMENDGEQYYLGQAAKHQFGPLRKVFENLARAENRHAELLKYRAEGAAYSLSDDRLLEEAKNVFTDLANYRHQFIEQPGQLEGYRLALTIEQRSIDLYQDMLADAVNEPDRGLLKFLIKQEMEHLALFEELETLLNRPVEWVESAEFGQREEY